jgi:hypothetical protein
MFQVVSCNRNPVSNIVSAISTWWEVVAFDTRNLVMFFVVIVVDNIVNTGCLNNVVRFMQFSRSAA